MVHMVIVAKDILLGTKSPLLCFLIIQYDSPSWSRIVKETKEEYKMMIILSL